MKIGELSIDPQNKLPQVLARNMNGEEVLATITPFMFTNPDGCVLLAGLYEFADETALFGGIELINGPEQYRRAIQAGRVEVQKWKNDQYSSRIKAFKSESGEHPSLASLTWDELAKLANVKNAQDLLRDYGAVALGTAGEIISVTNKTRNQLAMTYPVTDVRSLALMWGVTRITAIAKKFGSKGYQGQ